MSNILAIIPARGGSKGVERKNLRTLGGKTLLEYSLKAAAQCSSIQDIVVSTEDEEIANVASQLGFAPPFSRPKELATDQCETLPVVLHALYEMESINNIQYSGVMLLQPTCPFRSSNDIDEAVQLWISEKADSVVSVVEVGDAHPFRMKKIVGNRLINFIDQGFEDMRPRQVLPKVYLRNGAIYLNSRTSLVEHKSLVGPNCVALVMPEATSINIDSENDLLLAETLMRQLEL